MPARPLVLCCALGVTAAVSACQSSNDSAAAQPGVTAVTITMSSKGCVVTPTTIAAGPATFRVTNTDGDNLNEAELISGSRILAEKENLTPGLRGSFSYDLAAGTYSVQCLGGSKKKEDEVAFHVTAATSTTATSTAAP